MLISAKGKTVEELKGVAVDESGMAADADLAASATVYIGNFISGIEEAVNNAEHRGAAAGDVLALTSATDMAKSKDATAEEEGLAQAYLLCCRSDNKRRYCNKLLH